jgi:hypothetical protein
LGMSRNWLTNFYNYTLFFALPLEIYLIYPSHFSFMWCGFLQNTPADTPRTWQNHIWTLELLPIPLHTDSLHENKVFSVCNYLWATHK